ncbi:hypothetical protein ACWD5R_10960 [Streptomyces sp. NPDC002514]|uniref:hypothetical protein n=1 Tax=Streptomyces sp. NPDC001270 TaxID=3364554 RepID=UPI0036892DF2
MNPEFGYHVGTGAQGHITTPYTAYGESSVSPVESVFTAYEQSNISTGMFPSAAYNPSGHSPDSDFMDWFREVSNPMELFYPPDFGNQEAQNVPASPVYGYGYQEVQNVPAHPVYGYGNQVGGLGPYVSPSQAPTAMDYGRPAEGYDRNSLPDNRFAEHVRGTQPPLGRTGQAAAAGRGMTADDRRALAREVLPQLQADLREMRNGKGKTPRR